MLKGNSINILGTRGIPAAHGGFESFIERFALYMKDSGWNVVVYCQGEEGLLKSKCRTDEWHGITRVHISTRSRNALATMEFDLRCVLDVLNRPGVDLVLGYNTALFNILERVFGRTVLMNMDGIEWKRGKWGRAAKLWFWLNEWMGAHFCSIPIADHPEIATHLASRGCRRSVVIPYGADEISDAAPTALAQYGLEPKRYFISIARIESENSIIEIIRSFIAARLDCSLVILGNINPQTSSYHAKVLEAAGEHPSIRFLGAIYKREVVAALRHHSLAYVHGHQVGGTNPSLVESLGAGCAVIAHDNCFNRWTAGEDHLYFRDENECAASMRIIYENPQLRAKLIESSRCRHREKFTFERIHSAYRALAEKVVAKDARAPISIVTESNREFDFL
ncbi:hypothetical protein CCR97_18780 [Rhodoplanes elegans]|uniref:Glycosyl transferase n=1 Tax=Rhodoplanes elegans TaxID=29408 RepID=A0A327KTL4_9BRAD|nr:DUF1972 domain-containing protein [Rhodoplanes elegans]MBK5960230.1 hypothetical protein [Rhodoplanes elegans]RAI42260.1 hypothetical protein CH338_00465 [Rhodoplanes elegans]